jgi:hypothetical protein
MTIYGIDCSAYQGADITRYFAGRDFCFVKATEGQHTVDSGWQGRLSQARSAGLVCGVYHYAHPENPVSGDADHFISSFKPEIERGDLIAVDVEMTAGHSASSVTAWKDEWIARVQAAFPSHLVGLYCNVNYWLHETTSNAGDFLWVASYTSAGDPGIEYPWTIWQYTDSPVDTNRARFDSRAEMREWSLSKDDGEDDSDSSDQDDNTDDPDAFPGVSYFGPGKSNAYVTRLGEMLIGRGAAPFYSEGPGPTWSDIDGASTAAFQTAQGWTGSDADGIPGAQTWDMLVTGTGDDIPDAGGMVPFPSGRWFEQAPNCWIVEVMGRRLVAEGCSAYSQGPGYQWTSADQASYAKWQRKLLYSGGAADGIPGAASWAALEVPGA